jgi:hypothetical protein
MTTGAYELPAPALMQPESEHDGDGGPLVSYYTADQVRAAIQQERARVATIVQDEIARAEALMAVEEGGKPVFDPGQMDAGICALRTVAAAIRAG